MIYRDIVLAELTGGRVHILHVSTAGGVDLIREGAAHDLGGIDQRTIVVKANHAPPPSRTARPVPPGGSW